MTSKSKKMASLSQSRGLKPLSDDEEGEQMLAPGDYETHIMANWLLGKCLRDQGRFEKAIHFFNEAI